MKERERILHKMRDRIRLTVMVMFGLVLMFQNVCTVQAAEPLKVAYYYEEVCASCDGTKEFFELYNRVISPEDKQNFQAEIATYNVFMDSCREQYEAVKKELMIPSETDLPVLVIEEQWISGHDNMEAQMRDILLNKGSAVQGTEGNGSGSSIEETDAKADTEADASEDVKTGPETASEERLFWTEVNQAVAENAKPSVLLFSTNGCDDCDSVKQWFEDYKKEADFEVLEYNIIEHECLQELKALFRQYQVPEEEQKVPAVFFGEQYLIGKDEIPTLENEWKNRDGSNEKMAGMLRKAEANRNGEGVQDSMSLWTLAAAGLLAGFNPCSISMLLMLMSILLSEKASVWKNGLLYLAGKYAAYLSIGMVIFVTASQISDQTMEKVSSTMNLVMGILFAAAAAFYIRDAIRIHNQDYGRISTQLPVGLRRMNHNLIKKVSSIGGIMQPLMILVLGVVISFGEFFCTGQIYMASITYLLKDQVKAAIFPFLVYTTAMSIPAIIMILLIQKTRNTDAVSDFMFRHLGAIKIFNAVLFILFALYFLVF